MSLIRETTGPVVRTSGPDTDELFSGGERTTEDISTGPGGLWQVFPEKTDRPFVPWREALPIAAIFLVVSVVWIVFSDRAVVALFADAANHHAAQTWKGLVFVLATSALIFVLARGLVMRLERKRRALSMVAGTLESMIRAVDDIVFTTDREHRLTGLFGRSLHRYGLSRRLMLGHRPSELIGSRAEVFEAAIEAALDGEVINFESVWETEQEPRYVATTLVPLVTHDGEIVGALGTCRDVTVQREAEEERRAKDIEIIQLGDKDPLTGLPNRRALIKRLGQMLNQDEELGGELGTLAILDIDHFKVINASHGYHHGDRLLRLLSETLEEQLGSGDFMARTGSDEFALLFNRRSPAATKVWIAGVPELLAGVVEEGEGISQRLQISSGLTPLTRGHDAGHHLAVAETALFAAKESGRSRSVIYSSMSEARTELGLAGTWIPRIEKALADDGFELHLQPIMTLDSAQKSTSCFEVLLRLGDGEGALVPPGDFLPPAARFGWMPRIDAWVLHRSLALLNEHPELQLFVNLSAQALNDEFLLSELQEKLEVLPDAARRLVLEITESAAIADFDGALEWMRQLRTTGCRFAIDDFGSGFSTFDYLRNVPADIVKLDGAFIRNMEHDATQQAIVAAMARVCRSLGRTVVAEMVETREAATLLRTMDVTLGQGWLWSPALPASEAVERFFLPYREGTRHTVEAEEAERGVQEGLP